MKNFIYMLILLFSLSSWAQLKIYDNIGEVISDYRQTGKTVVTFIGHSGQGYQDWDLFEKNILEFLDKNFYKESETIINIGVTEDGIGKAYNLIKRLNLKYETRGIVSSLALNYINEAERKNFVDKIFVIKDESWGGYTDQSKHLLSKTSKAMVDVSHVVVGLGGGDVGLAELTESRRNGKNVLFYIMDINHEKAINKALEKNLPAPTEFLASSSKEFKLKNQIYFIDHGQNYGLEFSSNKGKTLIKFREFNPTNSQSYQAQKHLIRKNLEVLTIEGKGNFSVQDWIEIEGDELAFEVKFGQQSFGKFKYNPGPNNLNYDPGATKLSVFDLRQLSKAGEQYMQIWNGYKLAKANSIGSSSLIDIHSHFGGAIRGESLVKVALENNLSYPRNLLEEMGIKPGIEAKEVPLNSLNKDQLKILEQKLSIHHSDIINFSEMEKFYVRRSPLTKNPIVFGRLLEELAHDYQRMGVDYAELSISDIVGPKLLNIAHEVLPEIEKKTGVKLRFVVGIWRHGPEGYLDEMVEKVKHVINSPYVVGVDFMGHETNSTRAFEKQIRELAEMKKNHSHFKIKVHAGENPLFPDNVKVAFEAGADQLSHVLYGLDEELLIKIKEKGVILDFAAVSNYSLNNVLNTKEIPIKQYLKSVPGLRISLATDGHGLYNSSRQSEFEVAKRLGLNKKELKDIFNTSADYVEAKVEQFSEQKSEFNSKWKDYYKNEALYPQISYDWSEYSSQVKEARNKLELDMQKRKINFTGDINTPEKFKKVFGNKKPIHFSGASKKSIVDFSDLQMRQTEELIVDTLKNLDPKSVVIVTGGTDYGVEKIVHQYAKKMGFEVLGTLVTESSGDEMGELTHYALFGDKWYDKSANVLQMIKDNQGKTIFIGGGNILGDEIQAAYNIGIDYYLMKGVPGASDRFANLSQEFSSRAFSDSTGLALLLSSPCDLYWQAK
ncbi:MAG: hypothetical protein ACOYL6_08910 [Bacteriovoracaceae bacterium]